MREPILPSKEFVNFESLHETWSVYRLEDGVVVKLRFVLNFLRRLPSDTAGEFKPEASLNYQVLNIVIAPRAAQGPPGGVYPNEVVEKSITSKDISFEMREEGKSVYQTSDGKVLVAQAKLDRVSKSSLFNSSGDPIYQIVTKSEVQILSGGQPESALPDTPQARQRAGEKPGGP